ncbi:hypothetical protein BpHYR1_052193 [Brachionus plicatilis]|uniref:Uncharacterized protein n=1 Tax=Brachionus plicatilis TaxID=10195 RepID=A0A3M7S408_BRAPC|nr:hypothetical protein BpHYR1_052193 [Brachionus plicatilis]
MLEGSGWSLMSSSILGNWADEKRARADDDEAELKKALIGFTKSSMSSMSSSSSSSSSIRSSSSKLSSIMCSSSSSLSSAAAASSSSSSKWSSMSTS